MTNPFKRHRRARTQRPLLHDELLFDPRHVMTSAYSNDICRFVLECTCGAHFDTPYIDEALEIRELHETLAPLSDCLPV
jgi:hypothetical protein